MSIPFSRRKFLKTSGLFLVGTFLLPSLENCGTDFQNRKLKFTGNFLGEDYSIGHVIRDKTLKISNLSKNEHIYDVVIVGGGLSGLATAWKLMKSGITNFVIVEKESACGGVARGTNENGNDIAFGAHYFDFPDLENKALIEICQDFGVIEGFEYSGLPIVKDEYLLKDPKHNLFVNKRWELTDFPTPIANDADNEEHERFQAAVNELSNFKDSEGKTALGLPVDTITTDLTIRNLDKISMKEYLIQNNYKSELLNWYINIWLVDEYGTTIENCSAWAGLHFFREIPALSELHRSDRTVTFPQGLNFFAERISNKIPKESKLMQHYAVNIENADNKALTTVFDTQSGKFQQITSKYVVFALPKQQIYHLIPSLKTAGRAEFENLEYTSWMTVNIHLKRLPTYENSVIAWDNTVYDSWFLGYLNNHHHEQPPRNENVPHVLTLYACFPENPKEKRKVLLDSTWEYWAKSVLHELEIAHPEIEQLIDRMDIWRYGHAMRQVKTDYIFGEQSQKMRQPFGNVHFGHVDVCALPVFEEVVHRSFQIAEELISKLKIKN